MGSYDPIFAQSAGMLPVVDASIQQFFVWKLQSLHQIKFVVAKLQPYPHFQSLDGDHSLADLKKAT
jgi:hypothetical protein